MSEETKKAGENTQPESQSNQDDNENQANLFDMIADDMEDNSASNQTQEDNSAEENQVATEETGDDAGGENTQADDGQNNQEGENVGEQENATAPGEQESQTMAELRDLQITSQAQIAELTKTVAQMSKQVAPKEQAPAEPYYKEMLTSTPEQIKQQLEGDANGNPTGLEVDGVMMKAVAHMVDNALQCLMGEIGEPISAFKAANATHKAEADLIAKSKGEIRKFVPEINRILKAKYPQGYPADISKYSEIWATYEGLKNQSLRQNAVREDKKLKAEGLRNANAKLQSRPAKEHKKPPLTGFEAITAEMG